MRPLSTWLLTTNVFLSNKGAIFDFVTIKIIKDILTLKEDDYETHKRYMSIISITLSEAECKETLWSIAKVFFLSVNHFSEKIAMMYAHALITNQVLLPQEIHDHLHKKICVSDKEELQSAVNKYLIPYIQVLYSNVSDSQHTAKLTDRETYMGSWPIEHILERICDTLPEHDDEDDWVVYIDDEPMHDVPPQKRRSNFFLDEGPVFLKPKSSVDYMTMGKIYDILYANILHNITHESLQNKSQHEKTINILKRERKEKVHFYYQQALGNTFPHSIDQYRLFLDVAKKFAFRNLIADSIQKVYTQWKRTPLGDEQKEIFTQSATYLLQAITIIEETEIDRFAHLLDQAKKNLIDLYTKIWNDNKTLRMIQKLSAEISEWTNEYKKVYKTQKKPTLPETTVTDETLLSQLSHMELIERRQVQDGGIIEPQLFSLYLDLALFEAQSNEREKAVQAYARGKEWQTNPWYILSDPESQTREMQFLTCLAYHNFQEDCIYNNLEQAIHIYLATKNKKSETYYRACLTIWKRYADHKSLLWEAFLTIASYSWDSQTSQGANNILEKFSIKKNNGLDDEYPTLQ